MAQNRIARTLLVGSCLLAFGGMTAWSIGRGAGDEPAPMDDVLTYSATTWDLPVTRNDAVESWIDYLARRNADKTRLWMERSGRYAPMIRAELRRRGMPEDLLYLAFIESGFTPRAFSSAAASGMWQFMAETGRNYGLEVNSEVDERRDPIKSTAAALDYLQDLHEEFGSWYLAAAAYNSGENRIARILREHTGSEKGSDSAFWAIAPYLPKETRNYVPLMLAAGFINKAPEEHGFTNVQYQDPLRFEVAWVPGGTPLSVVAQAAAVTDSAVRDLNPQLMKGHTPSKRGWAVRIPAGSKATFEQRFTATYAAYRANPSSQKRVASSSSKSKSSSSRSAYHVVSRGESLSRIGERYHVSVVTLKKLNNLHGSTLQPGQKLRIRA